MAPRITCVKCLKFMRPKENEVHVEEAMPRGDEWVSYKLWMADLWACPECGAEAITGYARSPYAEHYEADYAEQLAHAKQQTFFRVEDC